MFDGVVEKMTVIGHVSDLRKKLISMVILDSRGYMCLIGDGLMGVS